MGQWVRLWPGLGWGWWAALAALWFSLITEHSLICRAGPWPQRWKHLLCSTIVLSCRTSVIISGISEHLNRQDGVPRGLSRGIHSQCQAFELIRSFAQLKLFSFHICFALVKKVGDAFCTCGTERWGGGGVTDSGRKEARKPELAWRPELTTEAWKIKALLFHLRLFSFWHVDVPLQLIYCWCFFSYLAGSFQAGSEVGEAAADLWFVLTPVQGGVQRQQDRQSWLTVSICHESWETL